MSDLVSRKVLLESLPEPVVKERFKPMLITSDMPFFSESITAKEKKDYSAKCNLDDEDLHNDCWGCSRFLFPIGCMVGEDGEGRVSE